MTASGGRFLFAAVFLLFLFPYDCHAVNKRPSSPCKIAYPSDKTVDWECRKIAQKDSLKSLFGERWKDILRFNRMDRRHVSFWGQLKVPKSIDDIRDFTPMPAKYPAAETEAKFIFIDLKEQFLGAYEFGNLVFSMPVATGMTNNPTPSGEFRITVANSRHVSSLYTIEGKDIPYPMNYALRFYVSPGGVTYWMHGRDMPGYPASHGCIGLTNEAMQKKYYGYPKDPLLEDAKKLFEWVLSPKADEGKYYEIKDGPRVIIEGKIPRANPLPPLK